ncbi:MAG: hypothetical protein KDF60_19555, partial [Calditrichaeota bacterium]|nr:hypothetical protein [Calditrichota bacterium]
MQLILILISGFLLLSYYFDSDITTFGKLTYQTGNNYSVEETSDGGFIYSGIYISADSIITKLIKTDANGLTEWVKSFPGKDRSLVKQLPDSGFILLTENKISDLNAEIMLIRTDNYGNEKWKRIFGNDARNIVRQLIPTADGGFLFSYEQLNLNTFLVKTDSLGNTQWQNEMISRATFSPFEIFLSEDKAGNIFYNHYNEFVCFDSSGIEKWRNDELNGRFAGQFANGDFFFCTYPNYNNAANTTRIEYTITDSLTNIIQINSFFIEGRFSCYSSALTSDNKVILAGTRIIKFDFESDIFRIKNLPFTVNDIYECHDGGYVFAGSKINYSPASRGILLKTGLALNATYIMLNSPADGETVPRNRSYNIQWFCDGVFDINLEYNTNDGPWQVIAENIPADSGSYSWQIPGEFIPRVRIRISDVHNPGVFVQNDEPFSIASKIYDFIATNQVLMWFGNNGDGSHNPVTEGNGFYWPGGLHATQSAIFEDGLLWGGIINGGARVNGNTHRHGLQAGNIADSGVVDPNNSRLGIWRFKQAWQQLPDGPEKDRIRYDRNNWPADLGAPWDDNDGDGIYDPLVDNPDIDGDEMFWMVMNDMDTNMTRFTYGSDPIGLEVRLSIYAYERTDDLADVVFKKYRIYNKGQNYVNNMFFAYWSDPDLGDASDDFVGCDTVLNLGYCWNDEADRQYGEQPPAVGYLLLQGPKVAATAQDSAFAFNGWQYGYKNEDMYAFTLFIGSSNTYSDPSQGVIDGSYQFFNYFNGNVWNGNAITDPNTNMATRFAIPGDPVNGTGWYEGEGWPGGPVSDDRRMVMSSGPFDFAPGDSQEVVYAIIMAQGDNNLDSITELKRKAAAVKEFYYTGLLPVDLEDENPVKPAQFSLSQNYPNP